MFFLNNANVIKTNIHCENLTLASNVTTWNTNFFLLPGSFQLIFHLCLVTILSRPHNIAGWDSGASSEIIWIIDSAYDVFHYKVDWYVTQGQLKFISASKPGFFILYPKTSYMCQRDNNCPSIE